MATHSSILAQKIPWTGAWWAACCPWGYTELDTTEVAQQACMHCRRKWQSTPVFLPGESQGQRSLVGCRLWGRTELDTTKATQQQQQPQECHGQAHCEGIRTSPLWSLLFMEIQRHFKNLKFELLQHFRHCMKHFMNYLIYTVIPEEGTTVIPIL